MFDLWLSHLLEPSQFNKLYDTAKADLHICRQTLNLAHRHIQDLYDPVHRYSTDAIRQPSPLMA
jgi:hypothetical protein